VKVNISGSIRPSEYVVVVAHSNLLVLFANFLSRQKQPETTTCTKMVKVEKSRKKITKK
jgi:hypothetical protein